MALTAKKWKQMQEAPKGNRSAAGDPDDQQRYLKGPAARMREQMLRQFMKGETCGTRGNSRAYIEGWERIFGGKHG